MGLNEFEGGVPIEEDEFAGAELIVPPRTTNTFEDAVAGGMKAILDTGRTAARFGTKVLPKSLQKYGYTEDDWKEAQRLDAPLMATTGGQIGNIIGEIGMTAIPSGAAYNGLRGLYKGSRIIPKILTSIGAGVVSGAGGTAMTGHTSPEELAVAAGMGGTLAPVMHGVAKGSGAAWDWAKRHPYNPKKIVTQYLQDTFQGRVPGVSNALRNLDSPIGERLTAGRAALADNGMYPELKVLDQDVTLGRQAGPSAQIEQMNRDIRSEILRKIEAPGARRVDPRTGKPIPSSIQEDKIVNQGRYDASMDDPVILNPDLENVIGGSLVRASQRVADDITGQRAALLQLRRGTGSSVPQQGGQFVVGSQNVSNPGAAMSLPIDNIQNLQTAKRTMQFDVDRAREMRADGVASAMSDSRAALVDRMRRASPMFADAEDHFAGLSRLQSQSDYAGDLLPILNPLQGGKQNFRGFLNRVNDPEAMLKDINAAGIYKTPEALFANAPGKLDEIRALRNAVEREVKYNEIPGHKGLTENLESGLTQAERAAPPLFTMAVTIPKRIARIVGSRQEQRGYDLLDSLVLDPKKMADLIESTPLNQRSATVNYLRNMAAERGNQIVGGTVGAIGSQIGE